MVITSKMLNEFREEFRQAMEPLEEKYGLKISLGRITYGEERFSATLQATLGEDSEDVARANFDEDAWKFEEIGIKPGMYKRIFVGRDGGEYAIVGLKPRSYKNPLRIIDVDTGKRYQAGRGFIREWKDTYYAEVH